MVKLMHKYIHIYLFLGSVDEPGKNLSIILAPPAAYFPEKHYEKLHTFPVGKHFQDYKYHNVTYKYTAGIINDPNNSLKG